MRTLYSVLRLAWNSWNSEKHYPGLYLVCCVALCKLLITFTFQESAGTAGVARGGWVVEYLQILRKMAPVTMLPLVPTSVQGAPPLPPVNWGCFPGQVEQGGWPSVQLLASRSGEVLQLLLCCLETMLQLLLGCLEIIVKLGPGTYLVMTPVEPARGWAASTSFSTGEGTTLDLPAQLTSQAGSHSSDFPGEETSEPGLPRSFEGLSSH